VHADLFHSYKLFSLIPIPRKHELLLSAFDRPAIITNGTTVQNAEANPELL
jgi:hypothetical protein